MRDPHPLAGTDVVVDGQRLHVVRHGRGAGVPLLLVHGVPSSSYLWRDVMRDLEHTVPSVAADLVGLGRSERARVGGYALSQQGRLLLGLLDELGLGKVAVAGHGLGGAVAVQLAALAPERVAGLALLGSPLHADSWPPPALLPFAVPGMGTAYAAAVAARPSLAARFVTQALGAAGVLDGRVLETYTALLRGRDGAQGAARLTRSADLAATAAAWDVVRAAPPPTLLLWGSDDAVHSVAYGRRLADQHPAATWVPLTGCGHLLPEECPERVAEELAGFLADDVEGGAAAPLAARPPAQSPAQ